MVSNFHFSVCELDGHEHNRPCIIILYLVFKNITGRVYPGWHHGILAWLWGQLCHPETQHCQPQFQPCTPVPTGVAFPQHLPNLLCKQINSKVLVLLGSVALNCTHDSDSVSAVSTAGAYKHHLWSHSPTTSSKHHITTSSFTPTSQTMTPSIIFHLLKHWSLLQDL